MHGLSRHDPTGVRLAAICFVAAVALGLIVGLAGCTAQRSTVEDGQGFKATNLRVNLLRRGTFANATTGHLPGGGVFTQVQVACDSGVSGKAALGGAAVGGIATGSPLGVMLGGLSGAVSDVFGGEPDPMCLPAKDRGSRGAGGDDSGDLPPVESPLP